MIENNWYNHEKWTPKLKRIHEMTISNDEPLKQLKKRLRTKNSNTVKIIIKLKKA